MRRTLLVAALGAMMIAGAAAVIVLRAQSRAYSSVLRPRAFSSQFARQPVSPHESTTQHVGAATITITYGRPSMRGRVIFGSLVPFGRVWCPGADAATTLDADRALQIGKLTVPPGSHTIWVLPTESDWTFIVSREPEGFHTLYPRDADLGRVPFAKRELAEPVEQLTFEIRPESDASGTIAMLWERTEASVPFHLAGK